MNSQDEAIIAEKHNIMFGLKVQKRFEFIRGGENKELANKRAWETVKAKYALTCSIEELASAVNTYAAKAKKAKRRNETKAIRQIRGGPKERIEALRRLRQQTDEEIKRLEALGFTGEFFRVRQRKDSLTFLVQATITHSGGTIFTTPDREEAISVAQKLEALWQERCSGITVSPSGS